MKKDISYARQQESRLKGDVNNILCLTGSRTIGVATTCLDELFRCRSQLNVDSIDLV